ncbi:hypothetical protein B0H13DRAFT_1864606 [Mycena leptocephala]|nr:hypothetical protein B0H13DRAFT_1864606 [Mycena leptocephala]
MYDRRWKELNKRKHTTAARHIRRFSPQHIPCNLECFSVKGFEQNSDVLAWLSNPEYAPRPRALSLYLPNNADPPALSVISKFLCRLNGHLRSLRLDVYPSPYLQWSITQLELGSLTSLQRLRIGHGIYFYPPETPSELGTCRIFPVVLEIALPFTSRNRLDELIFDVDISAYILSSSDSMLRNMLTDPAVEQIPTVRFHVLRGHQSYETVARCRMQFTSLMRARGLIGRDVIYSDECRYRPKIRYAKPHSDTYTVDTIQAQLKVKCGCAEFCGLGEASEAHPGSFGWRTRRPKIRNRRNFSTIKICGVPLPSGL